MGVIYGFINFKVSEIILVKQKDYKKVLFGYFRDD